MNVVDNVVSIPPPFTCDEFNHHLLNASAPLSDDQYVPAPVSTNAAVFDFQLVSEEEVLNAIHKVKSDATGLDNIPLSFIKMLFPVIGGAVRLIFNRSMRHSKYPKLWKSAKILPVAKNYRSKNCSEYRPISILPALSKALEIILKEQIMHHVNTNSLLFELQSGFRLGHSTSTTMLDVTQIVMQCFERKEVVFLVLQSF